MEETNVAQQSREGDKIVQAASLQRSWRVNRRGGFAGDFEADCIKPGSATAEEHEPKCYLFGVCVYIADDLVVPPCSGGNGTVAHIIEKADLTSLSVDPDPELSSAA